MILGSSEASWDGLGRTVNVAGRGPSVSLFLGRRRDDRTSAIVCWDPEGGEPNRGARAIGPGGPRGRRIWTGLAALEASFKGPSA